MDEDVKAKWVTALRSGAYAQTKSQLRNDMGHCCLGVLCDLHDPDGWEDDETYLGDSVDDLPALDVLRPAGLDLATAKTLAEMNDAGTSFAQIADWIEANL
jgi:hypothetical protein